MDNLYLFMQAHIKLKTSNLILKVKLLHNHFDFNVTRNQLAKFSVVLWTAFYQKPKKNYWSVDFVHRGCCHKHAPDICTNVEPIGRDILIEY